MQTLMPYEWGRVIGRNAIIHFLFCRKCNTEYASGSFPKGCPPQRVTEWKKKKEQIIHRCVQNVFCGLS